MKDNKTHETTISGCKMPEQNLDYYYDNSGEDKEKTPLDRNNFDEVSKW